MPRPSKDNCILEADGILKRDRRRRTIIIAGLVFATSICVVCNLSLHSTRDWRRLGLSFSGFTNTAAGQMAVIAIKNAGSSPVVLGDNYRLESVGVAPFHPVPGLTNLTRMIATHTNLVIGPSQQGDFLIPVPQGERHWFARLEFSPAALKTDVGKYLVKRQEPWAKLVPHSIRGVPVDYVDQEFSK